jgi:hypothetical protein
MAAVDNIISANQKKYEGYTCRRQILRRKNQSKKLKVSLQHHGFDIPISPFRQWSVVSEREDYRFSHPNINQIIMDLQ